MDTVDSGLTYLSFMYGNTFQLQVSFSFFSQHHRKPSSFPQSMLHNAYFARGTADSTFDSVVCLLQGAIFFASDSF